MKTLALNEALYRYLLNNVPLVNPVLPELAHETRKLADASMQISPDQGAFLHLLAKVMGARRVLEVGCFTGYSAIAVASALPADGELVTLDVSAEFADVARKYFQKAGLESRIQLIVKPALATLQELFATRGEGHFDLMFIDADKENIERYFEWGLKLVRKGGVILVDNVLWGGSVLDTNDTTAATCAIRAFNAIVQHDPRVEASMLHIADGLYFIRKK